MAQLVGFVGFSSPVTHLNRFRVTSARQEWSSSALFAVEEGRYMILSHANKSLNMIIESVHFCNGIK